jgi:putative ABC transport system ATP-binding protein
MRVLRARVDAGAAGLLVTHEPRFAAWADRTVFLRDGLLVDTTGGPSDPESLLSTVGERCWPGVGTGCGPRSASPAGTPRAAGGARRWWRR